MTRQGEPTTSTTKLPTLTDRERLAISLAANNGHVTVSMLQNAAALGVAPPPRRFGHSPRETHSDGMARARATHASTIRCLDKIHGSYSVLRSSYAVGWWAGIMPMSEVSYHAGAQISPKRRCF